MMVTLTPFALLMYLMPYRSLTCTALLLGSLAVISCGGEPTKTVLEPRLEVLQGNLQTGDLNAKLPVAFIVRVTDGSRRGVPDVPVEWRVTQGAGDLLSVRDELPVSVTLTDPSGVATVSFRPTVLNEILVTASAAVVPGSPTTINVFAKNKPDAVIRMRSGFDCGEPTTFTGPDGSNEVTVTVGSVVEWVYDEGSRFPCQARLRSTTEPLGGTEVDRILNNNERFQFIPDVEGTWVFTDANYGGRLTLTVTKR